MEIYTILLIISYILYNFKLPYYSTVKGAFIVSLVVPFVYFLLKGIRPYKKYLLPISFYILLYTLVIMKNFYIVRSWYGGA